MKQIHYRLTTAKIFWPEAGKKGGENELNLKRILWLKNMFHQEKKRNSAIIICVTGRCLFRSLRRIGQQTRTLLFVLIPNLSIRDDWKKRGIFLLSIPVQIKIKKGRRKNIFPWWDTFGTEKRKVDFVPSISPEKKIYKDLLCFTPSFLSCCYIALFSPYPF